MRRNTALGVGLAAVVAASGVGWVAGRQIRSPAELAARTAPPAPSLITVPVEKRALSSDVVVRGTVRYGAPQVVSLATSALKKSTGIVTTAPLKGATVSDGSVALAVSGRPVLVLQGAQPAYRDLGPGMAGADVRQLEEGLARQGFAPGPIDGVYDNRTAAAVAAWYLAAGWTPLGPTDEQLQALRAAQSDLFGTQSDLLGAQENLAAARASLATAEQRATAARTAAQAGTATEAVARAKAEQDRLAAEAEIANRTGALDAAIDAERVARLRLDEARSGQPVPASPAELDALRAQLAQATAAISVAQADLTAAQAAAEAARLTGAADIAAKQAALDALLAASPQDPTAIAVARAELSAAQAGAEAARLTGAADVAAKQAALDAAVADKRTAEARLAEATVGVSRASSPAELAALEATLHQATSAVGVARADLAVAQAAAAAIPAPPPPGSTADQLAREAAVADAEASAAAQAVDLAQRRVALIAGHAATSALGELTAKLGVQVPADEVLFFPTVPLRVDDVKVKVGEQVSGPVMTVTNSRLVVDAALSVSDAKLVRKGAAVTLSEPDLAIRAAGIVSDLADTPGTRGVDPQRFYLEVTPTDAPASLIGASVVLTIAVDTTQGEVLAVPVAALSVAADGTTRVQVQDRDRTTRYVTVTPGLAAKGLVAVTPVGGSLRPADLVVVGATAGRPPVSTAATTSPAAPTTPGG